MLLLRLRLQAVPFAYTALTDESFHYLVTGERVVDHYSAHTRHDKIPDGGHIVGAESVFDADAFQPADELVPEAGVFAEYHCLQVIV